MCVARQEDIKNAILVFAKKVEQSKPLEETSSKQFAN